MSIISTKIVIRSSRQSRIMSISLKVGNRSIVRRNSQRENVIVF